MANTYLQWYDHLLNVELVILNSFKIGIRSFPLPRSIPQPLSFCIFLVVIYFICMLANLRWSS